MVLEDFDRKYRQQGAGIAPSKTRRMQEIIQAIAVTIGKGGARASYEQNRGQGLGSGSVAPLPDSGVDVGGGFSGPGSRGRAAPSFMRMGENDLPALESFSQRLMDDPSSYEIEEHGRIVRRSDPGPVEGGVNGLDPDGPTPEHGAQFVEYEDGYRAVRCLRPDLGCGDVGDDVGVWYEGP